MRLDALIGVVGPCGAGKSSLVAGLRAQDYRAKAIAQEHSYVPAMWKVITAPDFLIYLEVSYPLTVTRRKLDWTEGEYEKQLIRLRHARDHADLIISTDDLSIIEVLQSALKFLSQQ